MWIIYSSVPHKYPVLYKRPCTSFHGINVAAPIQIIMRFISPVWAEILESCYSTHRRLPIYNTMGKLRAYICLLIHSPISDGGFTPNVICTHTHSHTHLHMNSKSSWAVPCDEFPIRSIDYFALVTSVADFDFNFPAQTQQASHVAKTRVLSDQQHTHSY